MTPKSRWTAISISALIALGLATLLFVDSRQLTGDDLTVRVGYKSNSGYQNYFVARDQRFFEKHGVTVEGTTFQSTNQMLQALAMGQIDATAAGSVEVVAKMAENDPDAIRAYLTLVFSKDNAFYSVLVRDDSPMKNLADLKGKRVGALPGSTTTAWFRQCVKNFFDPNEVEILQIEPKLQLQALAAGEVDALYTVDPIVTMGVVNGVAKVMVKGPEYDYILETLATGAGLISMDFVKEKPEATRRFVAAMYDAVDFMRANEEQTREIIATSTNLDAAVAARMDLIGYWKLDETDFTIVQQYLDFLASARILDRRIDARSLYIPRRAIEE